VDSTTSRVEFHASFVFLFYFIFENAKEVVVWGGGAEEELSHGKPKEVKCNKY
jgi:hypothetical protein